MEIGSREKKIILCYFNPSKQDTILAELLQIHKEHIVGYHEHDSLLDHKEEEELTEEERKAAWAEYEAEKKVVHSKCFLVLVFVLVIWKSSKKRITFGTGNNNRESLGTES